MLRGPEGKGIPNYTRLTGGGGGRGTETSPVRPSGARFQLTVGMTVDGQRQLPRYARRPYRHDRVFS